MAQACFAGPNGIAPQFSAHAVDENAAAKAINAEVILSVAVTDPSSASAFANAAALCRTAGRQQAVCPRLSWSSDCTDNRRSFLWKMRTIASALSKFV
jgi:hypothetical protein